MSRRRKVKHLLLSGLQQQHGIVFCVYESYSRYSGTASIPAFQPGSHHPMQPSHLSLEPRREAMTWFELEGRDFAVPLLMKGIKSWGGVWR